MRIPKKDDTHIVIRQIEHWTDKEFDEAMTIVEEQIKQEKLADKANATKAKKVTQ